VLTVSTFDYTSTCFFPTYDQALKVEVWMYSGKAMSVQVMSILLHSVEPTISKLAYPITYTTYGYQIEKTMRKAPPPYPPIHMYI
jgi:hypothetical protein